MRYAHFKDVVGVGEKNEVVMVLTDVFFEGFEFGVEAHDPAVCHSAEDGDTKEAAGFYVGCAVEAADHGSACAPESCGVALRTAKAEFHECVFRCDGADAACFGSDEAFMVHDHGKSCFDQHGFGGRAVEAEKDFSRECDGAFRHGIDVAMEAEVFQVVEEFRIEDAKASQVLDVFCIVTEVLHEVDKVLNAGHDGVSAVEWVLSVKAVKDDFSFVHAFLEKRICHCQLIKVRNKPV